jgi:hypothetical protein
VKIGVRGGLSLGGGGGGGGAPGVEDFSYDDLKFRFDIPLMAINIRYENVHYTIFSVGMNS